MSRGNPTVPAVTAETWLHVAQDSSAIVLRQPSSLDKPSEFTDVFPNRLSPFVAEDPRFAPALAVASELALGTTIQLILSDSEKATDLGDPALGWFEQTMRRVDLLAVPRLGYGGVTGMDFRNRLLRFLNGPDAPASFEHEKNEGVFADEIIDDMQHAVFQAGDDADEARRQHHPDADDLQSMAQLAGIITDNALQCRIVAATVSEIHARRRDMHAPYVAGVVTHSLDLDLERKFGNLGFAVETHHMQFPSEESEICAAIMRDGCIMAS